MAEEQGSRIVGRLVGRQHAGISEPLTCPSHTGVAEGGQPSAPASQPPAASISRPQTNRANERATKRRKRLGSSRHSTTCALPNRVRVHMPGGKVSSVRSSGQPALSTRARRSPTDHELGLAMAHVNDGMRHVDERICERLAKCSSIRFRDEQEPFVGPEPQGGNPGPLCRGARFLRQGQAEHLASLLARNLPSPEYETTGRAVLAQREGAAVR